MAKPKVTRFELELLEQLWKLGTASVREIQESLPEKDRPAYTTVQTTVYRLEAKKAIRRVKKISNAHIFEAVLSRTTTHGRLVDDLLAFFRGGSRPLMAHLIKAGKLTLDDVRDAERTLLELERSTPRAEKRPDRKAKSS